MRLSSGVIVWVTVIAGIHFATGGFAKRVAKKNTLEPRSLSHRKLQAVLIVSTLVLAMLFQIPFARSQGGASITLTPDSGPVGTNVVATVTAPSIAYSGGPSLAWGNLSGLADCQGSDGTYQCPFTALSVPAGTYSVCADYVENGTDGEPVGESVCTDFGVVPDQTTTRLFCADAANDYDFWTASWDCSVYVSPENTGLSRGEGDSPPSPTGSVLLTSNSVTGRFSPSATCEIQDYFDYGYYPCTFSYTDSYHGAIDLLATYVTNQSDYFFGSSASLVIPSVEVQCAPNPLHIGSNATCEATVAGNSPTGAVSFLANSDSGWFVSACTLSSAGSCSTTYTDTVPGPYTIAAAYSGDENNAMRTENTTLAVVPEGLPTSTSVDCAPNPVSAGSETFCSATVHGSSPTGAVIFSSSSETGVFDGAECSIGPQTTCGLSYTDPTPGSFTITGRYTGDFHNAGSNATAVLVVTSGSESSLVVACDPNPVTAGSGSTCTATVAGSSPTGIVAFTTLGSKGSFTPSTCSLFGGTCSVSFTDSTVGTDKILAVYSGDSSNPQAAASTDLVIQTGGTVTPTTTTVYCGPNPVPSGPTGYDADVQCTATVTGRSPTGDVDFVSDPTGIFNGFYSLGYCKLNSGSCSVSYWNSRDANITATYLGDVNNNESSGKSSITVEVRDPTTTALNCTPSTVDSGSSTLCYVLVTGSFLPTGTVKFTTDSPAGNFGPSDLCELTGSTMTASACHVAYSDGFSGSFTIGAIYSGNVSDQPSGSTASVVVAPSSSRGTSTTVSCSPDPVAEDATTTCTVKVSGPQSPGGQVKFTSDAADFGFFALGSVCALHSGTCTIGFSVMFGGRVTVSAFYQGNDDNDPSIGTTELSVVLAATPSTTFQAPIGVAGTGASASAEIQSSSLQSPIGVAGTIRMTQYTPFSFAMDASGRVRSFSFNVTGPAGAIGSAIFTIPKSDAPPGLIPAVILDGQYATNQTLTQDSSNFYITFSTHFSSHYVQVQFVQTKPDTPTNGPSSLPYAEWVILAGSLSVVVVIVAVLKMRRSALRRE